MAEPEGLSAQLVGRRGALRIDLALQCGREPLVIVGPNGSGKTSVLRMLLGALRPEAGAITVDGRVLFDAAQGIDLPVHLRGLGYVPQGYGLFPHLTALGNVALPIALRAPELARGERLARARTLLARFDAERFADHRPQALSGGEQQRVALARALAGEPRALLLDEPLAALDALARQAMRSVLAADLSRLGLPALVVTHDPADAAALGSRIAVLEAGRIVQQGSFAELRAEPATPFVQELTRAQS